MTEHVRITNPSSLFAGRSGLVVGRGRDRHGAFVLVRLDDDPRSLRFDASSVAPVKS